MKTSIAITNLKCGGCASTITHSLSQIKGASLITVNKETETVELSYDDAAVLVEVKDKLLKLGYPEKGTTEGLEKLAAGARSYISCAIGKLSQ
jgi:copper chaperone